MTYGFRIYNADGTTQVDSSTMGHLYVNEFQQAAGITQTYTYPDMAGSILKVIQSGVDSSKVGAVVTIGTSGADATVTIQTISNAGYFVIMVDDSDSPSYGIALPNDAGGMVVSDEQYGYAFIGNATDTGTNKPDSYGGALWLAGEMGTFRIYTITSVYKPIAFIPLTEDSFRAVTSIRNTGGNTWEIVVGYNGGSAPTVKCFARMSGAGAAGQWGIRVYDDSGNRTWDSSEKMLVCKQKIDFPSQTQVGTSNLIQTATITGVTNPYVMAEKSYESGYSSSVNDSSTWKIRVYIDGWHGSGSTLKRAGKGIQSYAYIEDIAIDKCEMYTTRVYVIEGNNY